MQSGSVRDRWDIALLYQTVRKGKNEMKTSEINQDYLEVLVDIALNAGNMIAKDQIHIVDSRSVPETVKTLADNFTEKYKGEDWIETDYIQTIDAFADEELKKAYPLTDAGPDKDRQLPRIAPTVTGDDESNADRIQRTLSTDYSDESIDDLISMALSDLRHLADREGMDFGELDHEAHEMYLQELKELKEPDMAAMLRRTDSKVKSETKKAMAELDAQITLADTDERYEEGLWLSCGYCGESNHSFNLKVHAPKVAVECDSCGAISPPADTRYEALALHNDRANVWMPEPEELARRIADQRAGGIGKQ